MLSIFALFDTGTALLRPYQVRQLFAAENAVFLLRNADKGGAFGQLFQTFCAHISTGRTQATEDIAHGKLDFTTQRQLDGFTFRSTVAGYPAHMAFHGRL